MKEKSKLIDEERKSILLEKLSVFFFLTSVFFLPINMWANNLFLTLFLFTQTLISILFFTEKSKKNILENKFHLLAITSPFILTLLGIFYSSHLKQAFDDLIRMIPLLMIPILFIANFKTFQNNFMKTGFTLLFSCILAAIICWGFNLNKIIANGEEFPRFFSPIYSNQGLTEILGIHASYMAILVNTSIVFVVYSLELKTWPFKKCLAYITILVLIAFLFHLLSRTSLFVFVVFALSYLIYKKKWSIILISLVSTFLIGVQVQRMDNNYLRDRLFNNLNLFEKSTQFSKKDDRFDRFKTSYEVFKQYPIFGPGTADDDDLRKVIYKAKRDVVAYQNNYNAHNQFLEYMSTFGILGLISLIGLFMTLINISFKRKSYFMLFVFISFLICSLTESLLERSLGIVYLAIYSSFLLVSNQESKKSLKHEFI